jgi:hypothetical protein
MKHAISATIFLVAFLSGGTLSPQDKPKPDLSKLSSAKLRECQLNHSLCGVDKFSLEIDGELANRLGEYTTDQLLACFADWKICGVAETRPTGWPISDYLASKGDPNALLVRYWSERKWLVRNGIERVAYHFDTPEVTAFMQRVVRERVYDGEDLYWPANYLAKKCDPIGLSWLKTGRGRDQGSLQYQTTLLLFGKCGYRPAIPLLVEGLYDFSGNVADASEDSLDALYPDHSDDSSSLTAMQNYYCKRAHDDGFRVKCTIHREDRP